LAPNVLKNDGLNNLGFYSLSMVYLFYGICCLFSSMIIEKLGARNSLVLGSLFYALYIASFILASKPKISTSVVIAVQLITAALNGFGASLVWVA